ncbi:DNA repair protein RadC [Pseudomonas sp. MWU13-3659]|uniref:RadC family protein n=1 Tax=Pseudomonas sp. MWU13-3659 TaxID=2986964 RepID=UPI002074DAD9|nr:DNA repair protein RadC [Pseudomonas sp. MWU13-3659]
MTITSWPKSERPRERLIKHGPSSLSDSELLAVFLRTGAKGQTAVDLARRLLLEFKGLRGLLEASEEDVTSKVGLGPAKYAQLKACLELGRRYLDQSMPTTEVFESPSAVKKYLKSMVLHEDKEVFGCLFLNSKHRVLGFEVLFSGTIDSAPVYVREVVKRVLARNAVAVIFCHNHPSGDPEPSNCDVVLTESLRRSLSMIDVRVLDHIVIGSGEPVSMLEQGLIKGG